MTIVRRWMRELRDFDGSFSMSSMLDTANAMLNVKPTDRPLSWEVFLDIDELLDPEKTSAERESETSNRIQEPNRRHDMTEQNPLRRAAVKGNTTRVKCLLKSGWKTYPVDFKELEHKDHHSIIEMVKTARALKGLRWRQATKEARSASGTLQATENTTTSGTSTSDHQLGSSSEKPQPMGTEDYRLALTAYDRLSERNTASHPNEVKPKAEDDLHLDLDEHRMTQLHRYCEKPNFWLITSYLDQLPKDSVARVLTYVDVNGMLPLHYAATNGDHRVMELLLGNFKLNPLALVEWKDSRERTPLHYAAEHGHVVAVKSLLRAHGVKQKYVVIKDNSGSTALALACKNGHKDVEDLLARAKSPLRA